MSPYLLISREIIYIQYFFVALAKYKISVQPQTHFVVLTNVAGSKVNLISNEVGGEKVMSGEHWQRIAGSF